MKTIRKANLKVSIPLAGIQAGASQFYVGQTLYHAVPQSPPPTARRAAHLKRLYSLEAKALLKAVLRPASDAFDPRSGVWRPPRWRAVGRASSRKQRNISYHKSKHTPV